MMVTPGIRAAAAAACLLIPLWLGSCSAPARTAAPATSGSIPAAAAGVPEPQPQPAAAPETPPGQHTPPASATLTPSPAAGSAAPQGSAKAAETAGPASRGTLGNAAEVQRSPQAAPNGPALPGQPNPDASAGKPVYFVAVDDGGTTGVRFGCNDSLVAVYHPASPQEEPLQASLRTLLGDDSPAGLYNALEDSTLEYVSAYFDGTTVVVNLTGSINPGGECDIPRVEAQLTHTAIAAVGAARAEIYVDGRSLADVLSLR